MTSLSEVINKMIDNKACDERDLPSTCISVALLFISQLRVHHSHMHRNSLGFNQHPNCEASCEFNTIPFQSWKKSHFKAKVSMQIWEMWSWEKLSNVTKKDPCFLPKRYVPWSRLSLISAVERSVALSETSESRHICYIFLEAHTWWNVSSFPPPSGEGEKRCHSVWLPGRFLEYLKKGGKQITTVWLLLSAIKDTLSNRYGRCTFPQSSLTNGSLSVIYDHFLS